MTSPRPSAKGSESRRSSAHPAPPAAADQDLPFWKRKTLSQMSRAEWESLCDGCAKCCLVKLEYDDTGEVEHTDIACRLLDRETCRCSDYAHRHEKVDDCLSLSARSIRQLKWLPATCAYRLIAEGGRDAFYKGPIAREIVAFSDQHGGLFSLGDFADDKPTWVEPVQANYRGVDGWEIPPP